MSEENEDDFTDMSEENEDYFNDKIVVKADSFKDVFAYQTELLWIETVKYKLRKSFYIKYIHDCDTGEIYFRLFFKNFDVPFTLGFELDLDEEFNQIRPIELSFTPESPKQKFRFPFLYQDMIQLPREDENFFTFHFNFCTYRQEVPIVRRIPRPNPTLFGEPRIPRFHYEPLTETQLSNSFCLSRKQIKQYNEKLIFDSIFFPGQKVNKTAYIYELIKTNHSKTSIRKITHSGFDKIDRIQNMICEHAPEAAFYQEPKRGRPLKMTEDIQVKLITQAAGSISDRELAQKISSEFNLTKTISRSTINLYRHKNNFNFKPPKQRQELTTDQKKKRRTFAYSIFNIPNFPWRSIVFSDESRFCLKNDGNWVWRRRGENPPEVFVNKQKFSQGVMVYGAIGLNYKSKLVFSSDKIKSSVYIQNIQLSGMLEDLKDREYIFMQDGATCHTSTKTKQWLHSVCDFLVFWPTNSPDLNPIEMIWGIMKSNINQLPRKPSNCDELKETVQEIWDSIGMDTINKLIESFYYRLILVAAHNGESIQPYYRHDHDHIRTDEQYETKRKDFLKERSKEIEELKLFELKDLIWAREPVSDNFTIQENDDEESPNQSKTSSPKKRWTPKEDLILFQQYQIHKNKWKKISESFTNRSPESIKKRYNSKQFTNSPIFSSFKKGD